MDQITPTKDARKRKRYDELRLQYPSKSQSELVALVEQEFEELKKQDPLVEIPLQMKAREATNIQPAQPRDFMQEVLSSGGVARPLTPEEETKFSFNQLEEQVGKNTPLGAVVGLMGNVGAKATLADTDPGALASQGVDLVKQLPLGLAQQAFSIVKNPVELGIAAISSKKDLTFEEQKDLVNEWIINTASFGSGALVGNLSRAGKFRNVVGETIGKLKQAESVADKLTLARSIVPEVKPYFAAHVQEGMQIGAIIGAGQAANEAESMADFGDKFFDYGIASIPIGMAFDVGFAAKNLPKYVRDVGQAREMARAVAEVQLKAENARPMFTLGDGPVEVMLDTPAGRKIIAQLPDILYPNHDYLIPGKPFEIGTMVLHENSMVEILKKLSDEDLYVVRDPVRRITKKVPATELSTLINDFDPYTEIIRYTEEWLNLDPTVKHSLKSMVYEPLTEIDRGVPWHGGLPLKPGAANIIQNNRSALHNARTNEPIELFLFRGSRGGHIPGTMLFHALTPTHAEAYIRGGILTHLVGEIYDGPRSSADFVYGKGGVISSVVGNGEKITWRSAQALVEEAINAGETHIPTKRGKIKIPTARDVLAAMDVSKVVLQKPLVVKGGAGRESLRNLFLQDIVLAAIKNDPEMARIADFISGKSSPLINDPLAGAQIKYPDWLKGDEAVRLQAFIDKIFGDNTRYYLSDKTKANLITRILDDIKFNHAPLFSITPEELRLFEVGLKARWKPEEVLTKAGQKEVGGEFGYQHIDQMMNLILGRRGYDGVILERGSFEAAEVALVTKRVGTVAEKSKYIEGKMVARVPRDVTKIYPEDIDKAFYEALDADLLEILADQYLKEIKAPISAQINPALMPSKLSWDEVMQKIMSDLSLPPELYYKVEKRAVEIVMNRIENSNWENKVFDIFGGLSRDDEKWIVATLTDLKSKADIVAQQRARLPALAASKGYHLEVLPDGIVRLIHVDNPESILFDSAEEAFAYLKDHPVTTFENLDGGGNNVFPPSAVATATPPPPSGGTNWKPRERRKWQQILGGFVLPLKLIFTRKSFADQLDNAYKTNIASDVWYPVASVKMIANEAKKRLFEGVAKRIDPLLKIVDHERLSIVGNYRESASAAEFAEGFVKNRQMSDVDRGTAIAMLNELGLKVNNSQLTPTEIFYARRLVESKGNMQAAMQMLDTFDAFEKQWADLWNETTENIAAKRDSRTVEQAKVDWEAQKKFAYKKLVDDSKITVETLGAISIIQELARGFSVKDGSVLAAVTLAEKINSNAPTKAEFAKQNKLTPTELQLAKVIDGIYEELATEFGIKDFRQLGNYMNHFRTYGNLGPRQLGFRAELDRKFTADLIRFGKLFAYEDNPVAALYRYIGTGVDAKHGVFKAVRQAERALNAQLESLPKATADAVRNEMKSFLAEALGYPGLEKLTTEALTDALAAQGIGIKPEFWNKLTNTAVVGMSGSLLGFRPGITARDLYQAGMVYDIRFGRNAEFWAKMIDLVNHPMKLDELMKQGLVPTMAPSPYMSGAERDISAALEGLSKIGKGIEKFSEAGLKWSGQEKVFELIHGAILLERYDAIGKALDTYIKTDKSLPFKQDFYDSIMLHTYGDGVQRHFDKLINAGEFEKATKFLSHVTAGEHGVWYGQGNLPTAWRSNFGRILGQFNTWTTWQRGLYTQLLQSARTPAELAKIGGRIAKHHTALYALHKTTGINFAAWALYNGLLPQLGPLVAMYESWGDPTETTEFNELADFGEFMARRVGAFGDYINAYQMQTQQMFGPVVTGMEALGFPIDRTERALIDEWMGYYPALKDKRGWFNNLLDKTVKLGR